MSEGPSLAELATYLSVDRALAKEADRLCAERCPDAVGGKPCRGGCNAVIHGWRFEALASLRARARLREQRENGLPGVCV